MRAHQEAQHTIETQRTANEHLRRQADADRATAAATAAAAAQREDLLRAELQRAQRSIQPSAVGSERSRALQVENDSLRRQLQAALPRERTEQMGPFPRRAPSPSPSGRGATMVARPPQPPQAPTQRFSITSDAGSNIGPSASEVGINVGLSEQQRQHAELKRVVAQAVQEATKNLLSATPSQATEPIPELPNTAFTNTTLLPTRLH